MLKRLRWLGTGALLGVGGALWTRRRLVRRLDRAVSVVVPGGLSGDVAVAARQAGARVRAAVEAGRDERRRREAELWAQLDGPAVHRDPVAPHHRHRRTRAGPVPGGARQARR
ncbi:MAG: hypothetical protein ACRDY3_07650 [Acidimicrobiales bacterium]